MTYIACSQCISDFDCPRTLNGILFGILILEENSFTMLCYPSSKREGLRPVVLQCVSASLRQRKSEGYIVRKSAA